MGDAGYAMRDAGYPIRDSQFGKRVCSFGSYEAKGFAAFSRWLSGEARDTTGKCANRPHIPAGMADRLSPASLLGCGRFVHFFPVVSRASPLNHRLRIFQAFGLVTESLASYSDARRQHLDAKIRGMDSFHQILEHAEEAARRNNNGLTTQANAVSTAGGKISATSPSSRSETREWSSCSVEPRLMMTYGTPRPAAMSGIAAAG